MDVQQFILLLLCALKWKHTICPVLQLLYYFHDSVIFNLVHVGIVILTIFLLMGFKGYF